MVNAERRPRKRREKKPATRPASLNAAGRMNDPAPTTHLSRDKDAWTELESGEQETRGTKGDGMEKDMKKEEEGAKKEEEEENKKDRRSNGTKSRQTTTTTRRGNGDKQMRVEGEIQRVSERHHVMSCHTHEPSNP